MAVETRLTRFLNQRKWLIPLLFVIMCLYFVGMIVGIEIRRFDSLPPNFAFSIGGELSALAVAIMITVSILPSYKRQSGYIRIFVTLLTAGASMLFLDTAQMLVDGIPEVAMLNKVLAILVFAHENIFIFFFWFYVTYALNSDGKVITILSAVAFFGAIVFYVLPYLNFAFPFYFQIDMATGVYSRNPSLWWICRIYLVMVALFVVAAIFLSKESLKKKIIIAVFMLIPLIALGAGGYQYGVSLLYTTMMASLVMVYCFLFSDNEKSLYSTNRELGLATNIQRHMLPSIFPAFPERQEFDIYALMEPAKEVGGDFYDFFLIDETHLGLVMADVSDKGVPAALFMMASKIMVQNYAILGFSPKEVLTRVNQQICSNNQDEMFVTVWLGVLDLETGVIVCSNAGHEKPILKKPNGDFEIVKDQHGFVVGYFADSVYKEYEIKLEKGSKLYLYTDGVPEARDSTQQFGMERTVATLNKYKDLPPQEIAQGVLKDLTEFIGHNDQFDDITMLCLEYRGPSLHHKKVTLPADKSRIAEGIAPVLALLEEEGAEHKIIYKVELALDEVLTNVASYAYAPELGDVTIEYGILADEERTLQVSVIDSGKEFNPLQNEDPDTTLSAEERGIGGLGLFLVKKSMDEVTYRRKDGKNILTMKKKF